MSAMPSKKQFRPWYRLHVSTWVVMVLAVGAMTFWNVAGYFDDPEPGYFSDELWAHGWPRTYLLRTVFRDPALLSRRIRSGPDMIPRWQDSLTWKLWEGAEEFRPGALTLDVSVCLAIVVTVGTAFEIWRRRRARLLQLYLGELLLVVTLISGVLAGARHYYLAAPRTETELRDWSRKGVRMRVARGTPECLHVLLPGNDYKPGDRVISAEIGTSAYTPQEPRDIAALQSFPYLENVKCAGSQLPENDARGLSAIGRLKRLNLQIDSLKDDQLRHVAKLKSLQELTIGQSQVRGSGLSHLAAIPNLRSLSLDLQQARAGTTTLAPLGQLVHLRDLTLYDEDWRVLTAGEVVALSQLTELEEFKIWGYQLDRSADAGMLVRSHPRLSSLTLGIDRLPDEIFAELPALQGLEDLAISFHHLSEERLAHIGRCRRLRNLKINSGRWGRLADPWVERLAKIENLKLKSLDLSNTNVTDAAVDSLASMQWLRRIDLTCCQFVTPAGARRLSLLRPDLVIVSGRGPCNWDY